MALESSSRLKQRARELGFELAGVTAPGPTLEAMFYPQWLEQGYHGEMAYLAGRRGELRADARSLLPSARSVICLGMVYNTPDPYSTEFEAGGQGWVSRYAWGEDYHGVMKSRLQVLADWIRCEFGSGVQCKVCVDTSPLLERAYARSAGLGWIGKNCCLIDEQLGSWFFLGEILTSLEFEPDDDAPYRCGTCRRCIDACPTDALVEVEADAGPAYALDSRLCISYWTIELRGPIPAEHRAAVGSHVFGCDICQDVCPWNSPRRAATSVEPSFAPENATPRLAEIAELSEDEFNARFGGSPIQRSRYAGFLRNVAVAMGNSGNLSFREALKKLARSGQPLVREHAEWALARLRRKAEGESPGAE